MLRSVIFDFDGVIFDTKDGIISCLNFTLDKIGRSQLKNKVNRKLIGPPIRDMLKIVMPLENDQFIENCVTIFRSKYNEEGIRKVKPINGMSKLILDLNKNKKKIFIVSNKPKSFITKILVNFGLLDRFSFVQAPEVKKLRYNKTDLLNFLIKRQKLNVREAVMIGDRSDDIIAAKKNNMRALGVTYGYGSRKELEDAGADKIFNSVQELGRYLLKSD